MKSKTLKNKKQNKKISIDADWEPINPHAAGVDIGSREHWVAVPPQAGKTPVRKFGAFTADLEAMADWFKQCGVTSVAMESTGVYWLSLFQILERRGFEVILVNARQIKNVSGRKSDVQDCQWIQRLHTYGLLRGSFRPEDSYCVLRTYLRYRDELVGARSTQCQHMQQALLQMNVQLSHVLSDVTGVSGLAIIAAILEGERDPIKLAALAHSSVRASRQTIAKALVGDYRAEHLFVLQQAYELYLTYEGKINACDEQIVREMANLPTKGDPELKPLPARKAGRKAFLDKMAGLDMRPELYKRFGVDLTAIEGIGVLTGLIVLTEVGPDLSRFRTEKHFCSWLGLCPDNRISGGQVLSSRTRRVVNRLSDALRMAASTLDRSHQTNIPLEEFRKTVELELADRGHQANTAQILEEILETSGLLRVIGAGVEFRHHLLQEFFAGRGIPHPELLENYVIDDWWQRSIVFYFGERPNEFRTFEIILKALGSKSPQENFTAAIALGLSLQACYLLHLDEKVKIYPWVVIKLAEVGKNLAGLGLDPDKFPLTSFTGYYLVARDSVACQILNERFDKISEAVAGKGLGPAEADTVRFWIIVGLIEIGELEKAAVLLRGFNPSDKRLLLGIHMGCFLLGHLRVATREQRKLAAEICANVAEGIAPLRERLLVELKSQLLEIRKGKIEPLPLPIETKEDGQG